MPKKGITFALAFDQSQFSRTVRKDGRVVEYTGLENRRAERHRGFESLSLRGFPKFGTSKTLILNGLAFFHA